MTAKWISLCFFLLTYATLGHTSDDFDLTGGSASHAIDINDMVRHVNQVLPSVLDAIFHQTNDPVVGNPNGDVTLVEFVDYQCPYCIKMTPIIYQTMQKNPNLRIVFKEFPIRGEGSMLAAKMALAANRQGKYGDFHLAVMALHQPLTENLLLQTAKLVGLNIPQLKQDMHSDAITQQLNNQLQLEQQLGLRGTPTFVIGKTDGTMAQVLFGQQSLETLRSIIQAKQTRPTPPAH